LANQIGIGGFGRVFKATRKYDHQVFAIKRSRDALGLLEKREKQALLEEIILMKSNPHQLIVKAIDEFIDNASHLCIV
jgi:serine/threonine protein kinase